MGGLRMVALIGLVVKAGVLTVLCGGHMARAAAEQAGKGKDAAAKAPAPVPVDLLARSRGFHDLLEAVDRRTGELDQREKTVTAREAELKALEKTLGDELARLEGQGATRPASAKTAPAAASAVSAASAAPVPAAPAVTVTKIYESMKPEEAAPILDKLDDGTVKEIFGRMKEKQIGAILAVMNRERAVALTKALATDGAQTAR